MVWLGRVSSRPFLRSRRKLPPRSTAPAHGHPVVSLTFDDGLASQGLAADLLEERGLRGTFYVPSGMLGKPGRLRWEDIVRLAERGHEIGGHTQTHASLSEITLEQARQEIIRDRDAITAHGLEPVSFAYPKGKSTDEVEELVRSAGYVAGRGIGGIVETLPPLNAYRLRTPHSARTWTTAEHMAGLVLAAEHEEGWLIIPFHHLGRDPNSSYTTPTSEFAAFLDWLVDRNARVSPVCNVISLYE